MGIDIRPDQPPLPGFGRHKRTCPECGAAFEVDKHDRQFCTDAHKAAFHNRSSKIGRSLVPLAQAWRLGRNASGKSEEGQALRASAARAFRDFVRLVDEANSDDRAAGRTSKLKYVRARSAKEGTLTRVERFTKRPAPKAAPAAVAPGPFNAAELAYLAEYFEFANDPRAASIAAKCRQLSQKEAA